MASRRCTDLLCLILFGGFVWGLVMLFGYAIDNGDIRRLTHGFNFRGDLCGVDAAVADKPFLYWCGSLQSMGGVPTAMNLEDPVCVQQCPTSNDFTVACPQPSATAVEETGTYPFVTRTRTIVKRVVQQTSIPTTPFAGRYCLPKNQNLMKQLLSEDGPVAGPMSQGLSMLGGLHNSSNIVMLCTALSFVLGYAYLFLLRIFAKVLLYTALLGTSCCSIIFGVYCWFTANNMDPDHPRANLFHEYAGSESDRLSIVVASISVAIGVLFLVLTFCARRAINTATACVKEACSVLFQMPTLLLQPALELLVKLGVVGVMTYGLLWLASVGEVTSQSATIGGTSVNGLHRSFTYDENEVYYLVYWVFGMFWVTEFFTAMSQFCVAYAVTLWYYAAPTDLLGVKDTPPCPMIRGYVVGFVFHAGTMAFGGFLVGTCRFVRLIMSYVAKQANSSGNRAGAVIASALLCLVSCFKRFLEFINKNAYMDVALNSSSFCSAAVNALKVVVAEAPTIGLLNGACFVFQLTGAISITFMTGFLCYEFIGFYPEYSDPTSDIYIENKTFICCVVATIALIVAATFMVLFDMAADTLLYCFVNDKNRPGNKSHVPNSLKMLIERTKGGVPE